MSPASHVRQILGALRPSAAPAVRPSERMVLGTRRRFIHQLATATGVGLALPWLPSMPVRCEETGRRRRAGEAQPPLRFACIYFSNGVEPEHWWARIDGGQMELGAGLEPLREHRNRISFIKGLFNEQAARHPSPHMGRMANLLSGGWVSRDQSVIRVAASMDQVMAQHFADSTEIPSLVVGIEPTELRLEDGLSMIYGSCISWSSATRPATKEIYPARVYDMIFPSAADRQRDRSILDSAAADLQTLRATLGSHDRRKLDEYAESIRSIERRLDRAAAEQALEGWKPPADVVPFARPPEQLPQDVPEHMRLMLDLIVLAFQLNKTRVATCMLNNDLSQMNFGFLEGVRGSLHLDLTHNGRDPELEAMYLKTNQYHCQQLAYVLDRMASIEESDGTLLDRTMVLFASNLFDGDRHQADEMPMLLAGGEAAGLRHGRVVDVQHEPPEQRRACSLYLSLMHCMGLDVPRFGDADHPLEALG
ncbi:MAG: DUF1552 domain-containing protein [Planctomycetota bacterium]|nr:MAG: DUF1552 domain-containing protein [Planctomycetota bacterium]